MVFGVLIEESNFPSLRVNFLSIFWFCGVDSSLRVWKRPLLGIARLLTTFCLFSRCSRFRFQKMFLLGYLRQMAAQFLRSHKLGFVLIFSIKKCFFKHCRVLLSSFFVFVRLFKTLPPYNVSLFMLFFQTVEFCFLFYPKDPL